jgi:uncharacterized protein (DUF1778 family)
MKSKLLSSLQIVSLLGVIFLIWAWAYKIFIQACSIPIQNLDQGSFFTVLFGASSIALFILSLLVALFAILGWQSLKEHIKKRVKDAIQRRTTKLENELRGRVLTALGYAVGEMGLNPDSLIPNDKEKLAEAVALCRQALDFLKRVGGPAEITGLNNFVYYSCALSASGDRSNEKFMIEQAHRLRDVGQEHDVVRLQLTACRVFLQYGDNPQEKKDAQEILKNLADRKDKISEGERREVNLYLRDLVK